MRQFFEHDYVFYPALAILGSVAIFFDFMWWAN